MVKDKENNFHERAYPAVWNQYEFLVNIRLQLERKMEVILLVAGAILAVLANIKIWKNGVLGVFALSLLMAVYVVFMIYLLPRKKGKGLQVVWLDKDNFKIYEEAEDIKGIYKNMKTQCYKYIPYTNKFSRRIFRFLYVMMYLLVASLIVTVLSVFINILLLEIASILIIEVILMLFISRYFQYLYSKELRE